MAYTKSSTERVSYTKWSSDRFAGVPVDAKATVVTRTFSRSKTGDYLPHWKTIIRQGGDATTTFSASKEHATATPGHMKVSFWYPGGFPRHQQRIEYARSWGVVFAPQVMPSAAGSSATTANNQALTRLYQDIRRNNTQFSGMVALGEMREALRMIRSPAKSLFNGIRDYFTTLNKRKRRAPKHRLKNILSETWLEYSFGWMPLISDIKAAAETLARFEDDSRRTTARGHGISENVLTAGSAGSSIENNYLAYKSTTHDKIMVRVIYRVGLKYTATAPFGSARRLAELSGFTLSEFVPTVWELIPWSFLVDYFANVGDILTCVTTDTSSVYRITKTVIYYRTMRFNTVADYKRIYDMFSTGKDLISIEGDGLGGYTSQSSTVERSRPSSIGYPTLTTRFPPLDSAKWLNMAALTKLGGSLIPFR